MVIDPHLIAEPNKKIELSNFDTGYVPNGLTKKSAKNSRKQELENLKNFQDKLYASDKYSVLLIFQAMDAAGKDSTIKYVMSGVNPQGCNVTSFKQPSSEELDHDFLWRTYKALPRRGEIGIFNRSYYEEVLITKVHPEIIINQRLPKILSPKELTDEFWNKRYQSINNMESHLIRNGTYILKFFLHVSKEEQKKRFLKRINKPEKNWKFSMSDVAERAFWDRYQLAYEEAINHTSTKEAPWYIIPADHKWSMRHMVGSIITQRLSALDIAYPKVSEEGLEVIQQAKKILENEN